MKEVALKKKKWMEIEAIKGRGVGEGEETERRGGGEKSRR